MVQCGECYRSFVSVQALHSHCRAKGHKANRSNFFCGQCNRCFTQSHALQQHIRDSPAHQSYCRSCNRLFVNRQSLDQHLTTSSRHSRSSLVLFRGSAGRDAITKQSSSSVHNIYYVDCPICRKPFGAPSAIAQHIESGVCSNISRHQITATVHSLGIIPTISIPCQLEDRARAPLIIRTLATVQTFNGSAFICFLCGKGFRFLAALNSHLNSPAHDRYQFKCPKCKRKVKLVSGLIQHIESGACGIAGFKQVTDLATSFMDRFTKRLTA